MRKHANTVGADQISMFVVCCMHSRTAFCIKDPPTSTAQLLGILNDLREITIGNGACIHLMTGLI